MIDLKSIQQTYFGCGFKHREIKRTVKRRKITPRQTTLDKVLLAVEKIGPANRKNIVKKSGLSGWVVTNCLEALEGKGFVKKHETGMSGPYACYEYERVTHE